MANFMRRIESVSVNERLSRSFQKKTDKEKNDEKPNKVDFVEFSIDDGGVGSGLPGAEKYRRY